MTRSMASRIQEKQLPLFFRQCAAMLSSGVPLLAALQAMEKQTPHRILRREIAAVRQRVQAGATFAEALLAGRPLFDDLLVRTVAVSEKTGRLAETLDHLALFLEKRARFRKKIRSALAYPTAVLCIAALLATFIVLFVLPNFSTLFSEFNGALPAPTRFLLALSSFVRAEWWLLLLGLGAMGASLNLAARTPHGRFAADYLKLHAPLLGGINRKIVSARFSRTLSELTGSGVVIGKGLELARDAVDNVVAAGIVETARKRVLNGEPLSAALAGTKVFPPMLLQMLESGETSGRLDEMLGRVAATYEEEVETTLNGLSAVLQPVLITIVGCVVGGLALAVLLPLFRLPTLIIDNF